MYDCNGRVHGTMRSERMMTLLAGLALASSCAHAEQFHGLVKERAAFDLQCEVESLTVDELPGLAYGVRGCGQQATYVVTGVLCQNPRQLTKREVSRYCTPVLDHSAAQPESPVRPRAPVSDDPTPEPEPPEEDAPPPNVAAPVVASDPDASPDSTSEDGDGGETPDGPGDETAGDSG